ncbi:MAG TPA: LemA family protein, partial [Nevskiaceae bacterium]|nr:LemA family protein [Nevskiaceae bacterium]
MLSTSTLITAAVLLYLVVIYNGLVTLRNNLTRNWSNVDVILKQRHDEIPKLVEVCKQHMQFEQETLRGVMLARAGIDSARVQQDVRTLGAAEGALRSGLGSIAATVERYPELRANDSIMQLLGRITALENTISDRREFYNESVNLYNVRTEQFPDVLVARPFGFRPGVLLEFTAAETA